MNELKNQVSILHTIGKLDLISTEKCRKGFAKKNPNLYEPYEAQFVTNAAETLGWDVLEAHAIWKLLKDYSLHNIIGMIDVLVKSLNVPPEFFSYENMIESTKMKRDIYNLIKKAVDYQAIIKNGHFPPALLEDEEVKAIKNYVDGELKDSVDKAEFEAIALKIFIEIGDFKPIIAQAIISSMEKDREWFYSTRKAQFIEKGKALNFSEEELNALWDNLINHSKLFL